MNNIVIYDNDPDGWCSAHLVYKIYKTEYKYHILPRRKTKILVDEYIDNLIVLDISNLALDIFEQSKNILWIDHHKSTMDVFNNLPKNIKEKITLVFNPDHSTCYNTYKYFYKTRNTPRYIELISDFDSGTNKFKESQFLCSFINLNITKFKRPESQYWNMLEDNNYLNKVINEGRDIYDILYKTDYTILKDRGFFKEIDGIKFICVNHRFDDRIVDILDKNNKLSILCFVYEKDKWLVTVYSKSHDMSKFVEKYGGGGHPYAAGFRCDTNTLQSILNLS